MYFVFNIPMTSFKHLNFSVDSRRMRLCNSSIWGEEQLREFWFVFWVIMARKYTGVSCFISPVEYIPPLINTLMLICMSTLHCHSDWCKLCCLSRQLLCSSQWNMAYYMLQYSLLKLYTLEFSLKMPWMVTALKSLDCLTAANLLVFNTTTANG